MYTGWIKGFPKGWNLTPEVRSSALNKERQKGLVPAQRLGLISINSKFIDWIDRRFLYRGMLNMSVVFIGLIGFLAFAFFCFSRMAEGGRGALAIGVMGLMSLMASLIFYVVFLKNEFFRFVYYPIRFNRKTRKVYVFREKRDGGLLIVPWDEVFFHIGRGTDMKFLRDIRGEILDGTIVKDTFALGHCAERDEPVKEMWEFIRRYMEEGPEAVAEHPLDKYVELSVAPTWKNCLISAVGFTNADTPFKRVLLSPFIGTFTVVRWLVFKSCKQPVFPPEVEAECTVEPNDPNIWPVPTSIGEFVTTVPGLMTYAMRKAQGIRTPPDAPTDLASQFKDWGKK
ncbi:hypothetical protein ISN35_19265 [Xanthomonas translucens pv. undulosa]|uniref:DUF6708 domain-containing protein n=1 Tax=Xanthomonas translucens group TaxID=3390202 RepID=UPI00071E6D5E|nr:DUF6708 domain-containing protein [Xanthomonas translucens]QSQ43064.1 hypothetical protein ISN33_08165 [Xanthomonas translucens pv. translucens]QSQ49083.1 hypothetical protein ISN35_19265 [Xanthomonas translucens pv. undulosa]QSQ51485.1 hypothetical protein ISN36_11830 [Xanthomonas translucens pv. undulosa]QSQ59599.1 hypothetical protein ISN38_15930 [Xanthomonas translucens pv. undulosa]UKE74544.1 hypothetical protein KFS85_06510 [Xanthomonas translucens pv. phleipratensis]